MRNEKRLRARKGGAIAGLLIVGVLGGCQPGGDGNPTPSPGNSTDRTNGGATYVGSASCAQCHADAAALHATHGHAQILKPLQGVPPDYPAEAPQAGVPAPPPGFAWTDLAYVVGGYIKAAQFVGQDGYLLTTGQSGVNTQWNLDFPPSGTTNGFVPYEAAASSPLPYDFSCFQCHTTAPVFDPAAPRNQDGRIGIVGTWNETGVQCEACHGPGGGHFQTVDGVVVIDTARIFIDADGSQTCAQCHNRPFDDRGGAIPARDGFIQNQSQSHELKASGGHASFACTYCHDPHRSSVVDPADDIRNACMACHAGKSMAGHDGAVFHRGDYAEALSCQSCHMPYATRNAHNASADVVGPLGRMGDTRTHIFRINPSPVDYTGMFTADGSEVLRDADGRAAVTVDFVCLRCHNEFGPFSLTVERAAEIAGRIHELP